MVLTGILKLKRIIVCHSVKLNDDINNTMEDSIIIRNGTDLKEIELFGNITDLLKTRSGWYLVGFVINGVKCVESVMAEQPKIFINNTSVGLIYSKNKWLDINEAFTLLLDKYTLNIMFDN